MIDSLLISKNRFIWMLLAIQGGYVNIGGLLAAHLFVSHVTGFAAHFSEALIFNDSITALHILLVPFFFLLGSIFSSFFTETKKNKNESPVYIFIMLALSFLYVVVSLSGYLGYLGEFGEVNDSLLVVILAFTCGSQNGLFTYYSNSIIRTTHLTGITTDLGIGISKYFVSKDQNEGKLNKIRVEIIFFFILGGGLGSLAFPLFKFLAFIVPGIISLFIGFWLFVTRTSMTK